MFDSLQIYCQKVNYLNQKQICTYFKFQGWYLLLKKKHLPLCLEHKGRKEKKKKELGWKWSNFQCLVTKVERENNENWVIDFLWDPYFCVLPKWPDEEG